MQPLVPFRHQGPLQLEAADLKTLPQIRDLLGRVTLQVWIGPDAALTLLLEPDRILSVKLDDPPIPGMRQSPMTISIGVTNPGPHDWKELERWSVPPLIGQRFSGISKNAVCFGDNLAAIIHPDYIAIGMRPPL